MKDSASMLFSELSRRRTRVRLGVVAAEMLGVLGTAFTVLAAYALADLFLAFSPLELNVLNALLLAGLAILFLVRLWPCLRLSLRDLALSCDRSRDGRRQEILGAFEMASSAQQAGPHPELEKYLVQQAIGRALALLQALPWRQYGPLPALKKQSRRLWIQFAVALALLGLPWRISSVVLSRILTPDRDIPPYSRYRFAVSPAAPEVLYNGSLEVGAEVSGPAFQEPVQLVTRVNGREQRAACFQESGRRYSQRLEKVVQPLEYCFALGRARSHWHRLTVLLDPQIAAVQLRVRPPAYSRKPPRTFIAGEANLAELKGAAVELEATCNRPLSRGELTFHSEPDQPALASVTGELLNPHQLLFRWTLTGPAQLKVTVYDARGARNQKPYRLRQEVLPDEPPRARLTEPAAFALATPKARIPLAGEVEDDLELRRVDLVRTLVGYRDRAVAQELAPPQKRLAFGKELDLAPLGVEPGQELEFYLEAVDSNPDQLGLGVSETVRLQIISEEDYAVQLRARLHTEEFMARYRAALESLKELQREAERLEADLRSESLSPEQKEQRWQQLAERNRRTAEMARRSSRDMELFDLENSFHKQLAEEADVLEEQQAWLDRRPPFDEGMENTLSNILHRIGRQTQQLEAEQRKAEDAARISRLMEEALRFKELLQSQEQLVRRLERETDTTGWRDASTRQYLQQRQTEIAARLKALRDAIREKAGQLNDAEETLRETAEHFADRLDDLEILKLMSEAVGAAENSDKLRMSHNSRLALERMEQLLSDCCNEAFGGMAQCKLKFKVPRNLQLTLEQMMSAWAMSAGVGDGYAMQGYSPLNLPAYGPQRSTLQPVGANGASDGQPQGDLPPDARERLHVPRRPDMERGGMDLKQVPLKYRDALRKYYESMEKQP
ncbi:MAG TPA: hypothetical protein DCZ95_06075 [Verrucomicrobia bacterium]|nr:MAG: hypothetical protein A2X46_03875 [Lentisphaerae bacterium GWF2_57_35]HBA83645.1 hypothetical protein [Verrucomicrobiota bacterium]